MHRTSALSGLVVLVAFGTIGCSAPDPAIDAPATTSAVEEEPEAGGAVSDYVTADPEDPFAAFGFPADQNAASTTNRLTPVWLINGSDGAAIISGRGGAESVVLDTLGAADSVLVRIETRADTVVLEALSEGGAFLGTVAVPMDAQPQRVAFPR